MRDTDHGQIAVLRGSNSRNPFAMYVTEILEMEGFSYQLVEDPDDGFDLLIVPDVELPPDRCAALKDFASAGGNLLSLRPSLALLELFGLQARGGGWQFTWADRYLRLKDETVLQYHGPADLLQLAGAEALSTLQHDYVDTPGQFPAVVRYAEGGRRVAFTFDLARSAVLSHQGRADQAGDGPNPDPDGDRMFKPNDLFINHLDPRGKLIPQADVLQDLFVELLYWLTETSAPVPRVWHFPHEHPAIAFMNGDSDGGSVEDFELAFDTAESYGCKYTLYLMTGDFQKLSPQRVEALCEAGHEVSLHPWLHGTPATAEFREHLHKEFGGFRERYGYLPATVRNHSIIIAGWVDTPAIYQEIGLRMDLNMYPAREFQYGFLTGSALPVKPMNREGQVIDFYQQATLHSDDAMLEAKTNLPAHTVDEAITMSVQLVDNLCKRYHGVYQPCFHPIRMRSFPPPALEWYRAMLEALRSRRMLTVSGPEWCEFNDARRTVQIKRHNRSWKVSAARPLRGMSLLWPERVKTVKINGQLQSLNRVPWGGVTSGCLTVDLNADEPLNVEAQ